MSDFFPRGSVIRRVSLEPALLFGAGRALMLQLAHPAVAAGVADHSDFKANPFKRLQGTLEAMVAVVFGSEELATSVGTRIHWIHEHVVGPTYRANDTDNLLWVHATLVDSALRSYVSLVGPLSPGDRAAYYEQMTRVAEVFGLPRDRQPSDLADFESYMAATIDAMVVTPVGRELAQFIVDPVLPAGLHVPLAPPLRLHRLVTIATTPPTIRDQLHLEWSSADDLRYRRAVRAIRGISANTPRRLRVAPMRASNPVLLARATRHVARFEQHQGQMTAAPN